MELTKGLLQGTVVVLWATYAVVQVVVGRRGDTTPDPTAGTGLLEGFLATLPADALVLSTAAMLVVVVGLEVTFALLRRAGPR